MPRKGISKVRTGCLTCKYVTRSNHNRRLRSENGVPWALELSTLTADAGPRP